MLSWRREQDQKSEDSDRPVAAHALVIGSGGGRGDWRRASSQLDRSAERECWDRGEVLFDARTISAVFGSDRPLSEEPTGSNRHVSC